MAVATARTGFLSLFTHARSESALKIAYYLDVSLMLAPFLHQPCETGCIVFSCVVAKLGSPAEHLLQNSAAYVCGNQTIVYVLFQ